MSVKSLHSLGTVARAFDLLVTLAGGKIAEVINCFQRMITDPAYRRQVWLAMTSKLVVSEITSEEWLERETQALIQLGLEDGVPDEVRQVLRSNFNTNHYFIPAGLDRTQLIELARKVGMKVNSSPNCDGEDIPTEAGVLECDLSAIMNSTNTENHPFNLNAEEHEEWAKAQGGDGLTSVEEALYLMIRHFMTFGRVLFMGGWIRCRNSRGADRSLRVGFSAGGGLGVRWGSRSYRSWRFGAVARKSQPLAS